jgi:hypothetical protein
MIYNPIAVAALVCLAGCAHQAFTPVEGSGTFSYQGSEYKAAECSHPAECYHAAFLACGHDSAWFDVSRTMGAWHQLAEHGQQFPAMVANGPGSYRMRFECDNP